MENSRPSASCDIGNVGTGGIAFNIENKRPRRFSLTGYGRR
jgi:hypothetical protein